jgi:hypothetical protein
VRMAADDDTRREADLYRTVTRSDCIPLVGEAIQELEDAGVLLAGADRAVLALTALSVHAHEAGYRYGVASTVAQATTKGVQLDLAFLDAGR